jgi:hypothetical protein
MFQIGNALFDPTLKQLPYEASYDAHMHTYQGDQLIILDQESGAPGASDAVCHVFLTHFLL